MKFLWVLNLSLKIVKEANLLASRMARLARCIYKAVGWFSIGNSEPSLMWKFSPLVSLASLPGVSLFTGDQCALGGFLHQAHWVAFKRPVVECRVQEAPT